MWKLRRTGNAESFRYHPQSEKAGASVRRQREAKRYALEEQVTFMIVVDEAEMLGFSYENKLI